MRRFLTMKICVAVIGLLAPLGAQFTTSAMAFMYDRTSSRWTPVSEAMLDGLRGGFQSSVTGPIVSFGIERSVFLNGQLISSVALTIPDATKIAANVRDTITLVQRGSGNEMPLGVSATTPQGVSAAMSHDASTLPPLTTVIQNSLDHQTIQSHTVLNATVQALTLARSIDLGNALSLANLNSLRH